MTHPIVKPAIIAHRGGSAYAPENTLAAFQKAVEQGADGIELDVHLSADGEVVVIHDSNLERTTNGAGSVYETPLAALKELDAGSWYGAEFNGEKIPTLDEVFELVGGRLFVNVELKGPGLLRSELPVRVAEIVERFSLTQKVIFSSFNPWQLRQIGKLLPQARLGMLLIPGVLAEIYRLISGVVVKPWAYHPHFKTVTQKFSERSNKLGRSVLAWTVNDAEEITRLCRLGIYGIITDDPVKAMAVRAECIP
jgi:glycerophosphoryl diester phosphodiesterase